MAGEPKDKAQQARPAKRDPTITPEEKAEAYRRLASKAQTSHCPICLQNDWAMGNEMIFAQIYAPKLFPLMGGLGAPIVTISCENCGYIRFFRPDKLGIPT